ncbi:MAG: TolC family protein [Aquificaceae bacterium]
MLLLFFVFVSISWGGQLEELILYALENSPRVRLYENLKTSVDYREKYYLSIPNLTFFVGLTNISINRPYPTPREPMSSLSIGISQMYPLAIKRRKEVQVYAQERLLLSEEEILIKKELVRDIKIKYIEWVYTFKREDLLKSIKREIENLYKVAQENYKYGKTNLSDLLFIKGEGIKVEKEIENVRLERDKIKEDIDYLVGKSFDLKEQSLPFSEENFPAVYMEESPYIRRLKAQIEKLNAELERAKVEYLPDIEFMVEYMIRPSMTDMFSLRMGVSLPIWKRKREDLLILEKQEEIMAKRWEVENTKLELRKVINSLRIEYKRQLEILRWIDNLIKEKRNELDALELAYRYQKADFRDLLKLYREVWELKLSRLDTELSVESILPQVEVFR